VTKYTDRFETEQREQRERAVRLDVTDAEGVTPLQRVVALKRMLSPHCCASAGQRQTL
jgi:hypothetical protein